KHQAAKDRVNLSSLVLLSSLIRATGSSLFLSVVCPRMGLDSVFAVFMLQGAAVTRICFWLEAHLFPHARDASLVDDEKHVDPRDGLRRQFRRPHPDFSVVSGILMMKRQFHVAITGRQAVRVVIAAQHDDR